MEPVPVALTVVHLLAVIAWLGGMIFHIVVLDPVFRHNEVNFQSARLLALMEAGADVFRLNFSHGSHADLAEVVATIRDLSRHRRRAVAILGDLQGPKIRTGRLVAGEVELVEGAEFSITTDESVPGTQTLVSTTYGHLAADTVPAMFEDFVAAKDDGATDVDEVARMDAKDAAARAERSISSEHFGMSIGYATGTRGGSHHDTRPVPQYAPVRWMSRSAERPSSASLKSLTSHSTPPSLRNAP